MIPLTVFLSAFLLFQVQPMLARYILPWFGGSPAVWTTCLLFFQAVLLAGYCYAHWFRSVKVHVILLAASLVFLPIAPAAHWKPDGTQEPFLRILLLLAATVAGPYFLLSSTAPLVQRWSAKDGTSPWKLYALSNAGSFLGMLSYPFALEPYLRLSQQIWLWSGLYVAYVGLYGWLAWTRGSAAAPISARVPSRWVYWVALAATGTTLLMAVTNQITQDIAVSPFLWVLPLSVYLLSFIMTFESDRWYRRAPIALLGGILAAIACGVYAADVGIALWTQVGVYLLALFAACLLCHGELYRSRPSEDSLTAFYVCVTAGGLIGGAFTAIVAPRIFSEFHELPLGFALACGLALYAWIREGSLAQWTILGLAPRFALMSLTLGIAVPLSTIGTSHADALTVIRDFYGISRVVDKKLPAGGARQFTHGRINHGTQFLAADKRTWPTTYFGPASGAGIVLNSWDHPQRRVGLIGMGAATLAAWGRAGDDFTFYELNPNVDAIANRWFTYLKDSKATMHTVLGDARVQMESELARGKHQDYEAIVVDAFSGDSIPTHLITSQAADLYRSRLVDNGLLLFHISNRTLDLKPIVQGLALHLGWGSALFISGNYETTGETASTWALLTANREFLNSLESKTTVWPPSSPILWSDDYASMWHVLKF